MRAQSHHLREDPLNNTIDARAAQVAFDLGTSLLYGAFSLGEFQEDVEQGLDALMKAMCFFSPDKHPEKWAEISMGLGLFYLRRRKGCRSDNLEEAIHYLEEASAQYKLLNIQLLVAQCEAKLGSATLKLGSGKVPSLRKRALQHFQDALSVITKENWPEVWHAIHLELHFLYQEAGPDLDDANQRLSEHHLRVAFDFDRAEHPELYDSLRRLKELYARRLVLRRELTETEQTESRSDS